MTVRAAARVLHLARAGSVPSWDAEYYLRELSALDPLAGPGASRALRRLAGRRSYLGRTGVDTAVSRARREAHRGAAQPAGAG